MEVWVDVHGTAEEHKTGSSYGVQLPGPSDQMQPKYGMGSRLCVWDTLVILIGYTLYIHGHGE